MLILANKDTPTMNITILAIGKCKNTAIGSLCAHYIKRLSWTLTVVEVVPKKEAPTPNIRQKHEADLLLKHIKTGDYVIALDSSGQQTTSAKLATTLEELSTSHGACTWVIGGADGLDTTIFARAQHCISLGQNTWPHMLVRVMLVEQIYRAHQILARHPYHH
ncbi:MAG: 23S rRNA (pseudouridine(1915)-N(3))-methyltransferase RlmH [Alphaproteobacteria bacterium]|nr:MAG: 23S rRNA (pseudouridine(1915)-N(3))-methyltransferase RlmH [Alphaproteobacteria bacterium]